MSVSYPTFERLKDRGLAAYKAGDYPADRPVRRRVASREARLLLPWITRSVFADAMAFDDPELAFQCFRSQRAGQRLNRLMQGSKSGLVRKA